MAFPRFLFLAMMVMLPFLGPMPWAFCGSPFCGRAVFATSSSLRDSCERACVGLTMPSGAGLSTGEGGRPRVHPLSIFRFVVPLICSLLVTDDCRTFLLLRCLFLIFCVSHQLHNRNLYPSTTTKPSRWTLPLCGISLLGPAPPRDNLLMVIPPTLATNPVFRKQGVAFASGCILRLR